MTSTRIRGSAFALIAFLICGSLAQAADTTLRWKFEKGQKRNYVLSQAVTTRMELQGRQIETSFTQTSDVVWTVKDVTKEGDAAMEQTITRVQFEMTAPGIQATKFDTNGKEELAGPLASAGKLFRAMTGKPFKLKMTTRGDVTDVQVPPEITEAIKEAGPAAAMLSNEESLKNMTSQATVVFPKESIASGKSWTGKKSLSLPFGIMELNTTYTLGSPTGTVENIDLKVQTELQPAAGAPVDIKLKSQESKGKYLFDNKGGFLKSTELVQKMTMTLTTNGQEINQDTNTTTKMDLKP